MESKTEKMQIITAASELVSTADTVEYSQRDLKKVRRKELIEILYHMKLREESLKRELTKARMALADRRILMEESGSIAEASLKVNQVFQAAQQAADEYLSSLRESREDGEAIRAKAQKEAEKILASAKEEADRLRTEGQKEYAVLQEKEKKEYDALQIKMDQERREAQERAEKIRQQAEQLQAETQLQAEKLLKETCEQADSLMQETQKKAKTLLSETEARIKEKKATFDQYVKKTLDAHAQLQGLLSTVKGE